MNNTAECINRQIRKATEKSVRCTAIDGPEAIERRIAELDREWDVERALEANAAVASILGVVLGVAVNRKWFIFPAVVGGFLLQHAVQGRCPPIPVLRRLGFRTQTEIERERYALKALRGDFRDVQAGAADVSATNEVIAAVDR